MSVIGSRVYLQPMGTVINTILDIQELQNGKSVFSDTQNGKVDFSVRMYGYKTVYRFLVTDIGENRSRVQIEADGDTKFKKRHVMREFALLDSILIGEAQVEIEETDEHNKPPD